MPYVRCPRCGRNNCVSASGYDFERSNTYYKEVVCSGCNYVYEVSLYTLKMLEELTSRYTREQYY